MKTLLICSGGLDSVCLAYHLAHKNALHSIVTFDYNQRHKKEISFAQAQAQALNVPFQRFDLTLLSAALTGSALTQGYNVPDGHYAQETMKITEVPNRNAIFLTIAFAHATAIGANHVALAVHGGDHFIYPDCRADFLQKFEEMEQLSLEGKVKLYAPYVTNTKSEIVQDGARYNVPFANTWSCYKGGEFHCGRCGTCVERQEAFFEAGVKDPTRYADPNYWQKAVNQYKNSASALCLKDSDHV